MAPQGQIRDHLYEGLEMEYTVRYKKQNQWFWRKIKKVTGDGLSTPDESSIPYRHFLNKDKELFCIPITETVFKFSRERANVIENNQRLKEVQEK